MRRVWMSDAARPWKAVRCCGRWWHEKNVLGHVAQQRRFGHQHADVDWQVGAPDPRAALAGAIVTQGVGN